MKEKAKVITLCGSLKFKDAFMEYAEKLELDGYCVLNVIYPTNEDKDAFTEEQMEILKDMHFQRIDMADAIFVINVGGYIGSSTKKEIEYAIQNGKEVLYLENL